VLVDASSGSSSLVSSSADSMKSGAAPGGGANGRRTGVGVVALPLVRDVAEEGAATPARMRVCTFVPVVSPTRA
jgi:hypothetical protein